nr:glycosyltransferase [Gordonia sp. NB41Y]
MVWRTLARSNYNRIIVSSHLFAHHARLVPKRDVPKYVFVHSPARYIWEPSLDQRASHPLFRLPVAFARKLDKSAAQLGYKLCANSNFVRSRINRCWDRDARVIYPPVDTERISARDWRGDLQGEDERRFASLPSQFVLGASRAVHYKGLDKVLEVARIAGIPAVIAGDGPDLPRIRSLAKNSPVPVIFLGRVSDALLYSLYQQTALYVFPPVEDFGIMPVEAMAAGARVLVNIEGGARETVQNGLTGAVADFSDTDSVRDSVEIALGCDPDRSRARAGQYSRNRFRQEFAEWTSS